MLKESTYSDELRFKELSPEEKQRRGILGRLYGPMADIVKGTRNGRRYSDELWEKAFEDPLTQEMLNAGGLPGELDHPTDREETCSEKIAIMMPEAPRKDKNGKLIGYFDILDTPCGRIAYALAKYGFKLGVSSRGSGDTYTDYDGQESVDPDTYKLNAFDLVLLPAVKDARLQMVEGLDVDKVQFKHALKESLDNSSEEDRRIMTATLDNLDIDYKEELSETEESDVDQTDESAVDNGDTLVKDLQEALRQNSELQNKIVELNEKLSVSYTKEICLEGTISKLKNSISRLVESKSQLVSVTSKLKTKDLEIAQLKEQSKDKDCLIESLKKKFKDSMSVRKSLTESVSNKNDLVSSLHEQVKSLKESIDSTTKEKDTVIRSLTEEIEELKKDSSIKNSQYSKKLNESNLLVEKYKQVAKQSIDRYIESKATTLGISVKEIKNRLDEDYSFDEIDSVCENLRSYKLNMSKLPFSIGGRNVQGVALKEDTSTSKFSNPDDVVDKSLFDLL